MIDVSIIITAFNYDLYIEECVLSCLNQVNHRLNYEVIVVDDGSTDQTQYLLTKLSSNLLRKYRIENSGIENAANFGFNKANGRFVVRVDADDKLAPNYLSTISEYIEKGYDFLYSDYHTIDGNSSIIGEMILPDFDVEEIKSRGDFLATGTLYKKEVLKELAGYTTSFRNSGLENYDLILRLLRKSGVGHRIPKALFFYRRHSSNFSEIRSKEIELNGEALFMELNLGKYTINKYHPYR
jgi:glycosyltransferase involved in cell wall biosynthesis